MTVHDLYLLSPEISLAVLAAVVIVADLLLERKGILAALAVVGLSAPVAFSVALWITVNDQGAQPGIFDSLVVDHFALFFKFLVLAIVALVVMASVGYTSRFQRFQGEYYGLILLSAGGMMLLASTMELISIYVALELATLPLVALAAFLRDARSTEAGFKFLVLGAISSAVLLYGMTLVYGFTGTTHLTTHLIQVPNIGPMEVPGIAQQVSGAVSATAGGADVPFGAYALLLGVVLIAAGFGFKISSVPFQMWVPDVYEGAPTPITAYLSVASKAAGFAVILRVFNIAFEGVSLDWSMLFAVLAALSMSIGNLVAISQNNIKRMLAYSTVAHAGYLMVGLAAIAQRTSGEDVFFGPSGVLFYLAAYAATNLAAFFAIIIISNKLNSDNIDDFAGMGHRSPLLAFALAVGMISLIGIPPTAGFMAKLYIFNAAVRADLVWLVIVGVINSVVSAYYYLRVVRVIYMAPAPSPEGMPSSAAARLALAITVMAVLVLGIVPSPLLDVAKTAVATILPATP